MPYEIRELLIDLPAPITAHPDDALETALNRMLKHNYSQLPVVQGSGQAAQFYLITANKILETLKMFGLPVDGKGLKVSHAMAKVTRIFTLSDTITEVMDGLKETDAVLIVNEQRELKNIVTIYDTTHFFRKWSEDLLNARDIELALRTITYHSFKRSDGTPDEEACRQAINGAASDNGEVASNNSGRKRFRDAVGTYLAQQAPELVKVNRRAALEAFATLIDDAPDSTSKRVEDQTLPTSTSNAEIPQPSTATQTPLSASNNPDPIHVSRTLRQRFEAALQRYLERAAPSAAPNIDWVNTAYRQHYQDKQEPKEFNKLTLGEYRGLFFRDQCWGRCGDVFDFDQAVVDRVLKDVQKVRNLLAHFRDEEITDDHRRSLRLAADWMPKHTKRAIAKLDETAPPPIEKEEDLSSLTEENRL